MTRKNLDSDSYKKLLIGKKIPILILDSRWHELFPDYDKPSHIAALEKQLGAQLKEQGGIVNESKDLRKLKKKLMSEIMENMNPDVMSNTSLSVKKLQKSQQLILQINEKLEHYENRLEQIPREIKLTNEKLMIESMKVCYDRLSKNKSQIDSLSQWILLAREELKKHILEKQDMEVRNDNIYTYMHDMLGAEVIDIFDQKREDKEND